MSSGGAKKDGGELARLRHDLRTPINHILGYSELVREELEEGGDKSLSADLVKISKAAGELLALINANLTETHMPALLRGEAGVLKGGTGDGSAESEKSKSTAARPSGHTESAEPAERAEPEHSAEFTGRILVVDDDAENRETLARRLARQGHETRGAADGHEALEVLRREAFDLVLLDVMMPGLDGFGVLDALKADPKLRHVPVIMISALDELESVVRCIERGAEDYLGKPFEPTLLRARIDACLEKKNLRDQEREYLRTIEETQRRLAAELEEAANYVRSILPPPEKKPFRIHWKFLPSTELGGDSFGYHWVDDEHFACYLLDVCGHGVGAALLSVAAINVIRSGSLKQTDFRNPGEVVGALNNAFPMERHNNMYFTIWYGVFHQPTRRLRHASGGHPPSLLLSGKADNPELTELRCPGMVVGAMDGMEYDDAEVDVPEGARLVLLSDGAYEIKDPDGGMLEWEAFTDFVGGRRNDSDLPGKVWDWIHSMHGDGPLDDDFSMVSIDFDPR